MPISGIYCVKMINKVTVFSTESQFQAPTHSSLKQTGQESPKVLFTVKVTFELALAVVNKLVFAKKGRYLSEAEILVIKGAWDDNDYEEIASNSSYSPNYLKGGIARRLWDILSETIGNGERVGKKNLRDFLEQVTEEYYAQSASKEEPNFPANDLIQVLGGQLPDVSSFYGRVKELTLLKELIAKQRCISLVGVAGIGKTALAAKLLAEISAESQPRFDYLIWKSVAHAPLLQDLVTELLDIIEPLETPSSSPKYAQAMITMLLKQMQSRRCLVVLDESEALFQTKNLEQRLDYRLFFRRLVEEQHQSCLLLTNRILLDELNDLIVAKRPLRFFRIKGLDEDAAMQFLSEKGLTDTEKCHQLIQTYRGNPSELEAVIERINHFFSGSTQVFFQNPTTLVSSKFEAMLNHVFGHVLTEIERKILIYTAEEIVSTTEFISFAKLLSDIRQRQKASVSTLELIKALENLEKQSLIESSKNPVTKEISFTLQPVIKKYILTDPQGLVRVSNALPNLAVAS